MIDPTRCRQIRASRSPSSSRRPRATSSSSPCPRPCPGALRPSSALVRNHPRRPRQGHAGAAAKAEEIAGRDVDLFILQQFEPPATLRARYIYGA
jgi:hypothetical protein